MVEFKVNIADTKKGKTYAKTIEGAHANAFIGKRIGDEIDGVFVDLPGYKLVITGGSDREGFPLRKDLPFSGRKKILITRGKVFRSKERGLRKRRSVRGNTLSEHTMQINLKIKKWGPKPIESTEEHEKARD